MLAGAVRLKGGFVVIDFVEQELSLKEPPVLAGLITKWT
jgi:hypothetical protein